MKSTISIAFLLAILCFCSKSERLVQFRNLTPVPIDLKVKYTIQNISDNIKSCMKNPISLICDINNNLYVLDFKDRKIVKFDSVGTFVTSFGRKGNGPGEMQSPSDLLIIKDSLYIFDASRKIHIFSLSGDFIRDHNIVNSIPRKVININSSTFLGYNYNYATNEIFNSIAIFNSNLDTIKTIRPFQLKIKHRTYCENSIFIPLTYDSNNNQFIIGSKSDVFCKLDFPSSANIIPQSATKIPQFSNFDLTLC